MEPMELEGLIQSLRKRVKRSERRERYFLAGASLIAAVFLLSAWQNTPAPQDIRARSVSIVDSNGVVRLVLGAPLPNPVVGGKTKERRTPATGMIFNDPAGNERGGFGMLEDGSMNLCFDDAKTERNCLFFMPKFGNGVAFNDANGESRAILYLDTNGSPHFLLRDDKGHSLVSLPEAPKE